MGLVSLLPIAILYPLSILGDGCTLVAIALAATLGGRPALWGLSFALWHAFYGLLGIWLAKELTTYSELVGDLFVLFGAIILLRHFLHHRLHHTTSKEPSHHHKCECEHLPDEDASATTILSTTAGLSFHALAAGAVIQEIVGPIPLTTLVPLLLLCASLLGGVVALAVNFGETERYHLLRLLDKTPGICAATLTAVCAWSLFHLLEHSFTLSPMLIVLYSTLSVLGVGTTGYMAHDRRLASSLHVSPKA